MLITCFCREVADASIKSMTDAGATYMELDTGPFGESMKSFYEEMAASGELPEGFLEAVEAARAE